MNVSEEVSQDWICEALKGEGGNAVTVLAEQADLNLPEAEKTSVVNSVVVA